MDFVSKISKLFLWMKHYHSLLKGCCLLHHLLLIFWRCVFRANPGCLGEKNDFDETFARVIERGQRYGSSKRELAEARRSEYSLPILNLMDEDEIL